MTANVTNRDNRILHTFSWRYTTPSVKYSYQDKRPKQKPLRECIGMGNMLILYSQPKYKTL
jgi:hypothetical protein